MNGDIVTANGCGCNAPSRIVSGSGSGPRAINSFYDLEQMCPKDPLDVNFYATSAIGNPQLSFLNNAATRGDMQGTVPALLFSGSFSADPITLDIVFRQPGDVRMGFWFTDGGGHSYMYGMQ